MIQMYMRHCKDVDVIKRLKNHIFCGNEFEIRTSSMCFSLLLFYDIIFSICHLTFDSSSWHTFSLCFIAIGSDKVEMKDQLIHRENIETEDQHMEAGTTTKQQGIDTVNQI